MPLNNKDGSLPSTLGKGERKKKKKSKRDPGHQARADRFLPVGLMFHQETGVQGRAESGRGTELLTPRGQHGHSQGDYSVGQIEGGDRRRGGAVPGLPAQGVGAVGDRGRTSLRMQRTPGGN